MIKALFMYVPIQQTMITLHSHFHLLFFLLLSLTSLIISSHSTPSTLSYKQNCAKLVNESTPFVHSSNDQVPSFYNAYVNNGEQILIPNTQTTASLEPVKVFKTVTNGVYKMDAFLLMRIVRFNNNVSRNGSRRVKFQLSGFWNSASGHLCMVGFGIKRLSTGKRLKLDVVFTSNYPMSSNITSSLFVGSLESLNVVGSDSHFNLISIMGFVTIHYNYTKEIDDDVFEIASSNVLSNLSIMGYWDQSSFRSCSYFSNELGNFKLLSKRSCDGRKCSNLDMLFGFLPKFMSFNEIDCSNQRMVRVSFSFSDSINDRVGYPYLPLHFTRALIAEGEWSAKRKQFSFVGCRVLNFKDSPLSASVGDCSVRVRFTFLGSLNFTTSSVVSGYIWSNKSVGETGYFDRIEIRALGSLRGALPEMKYEYTQIEKAKRYCAEKKDLKLKRKSFPNLYPQDLKFDMNVRNSKGQYGWGMSHPVYVGSQFVQDTNSYFYSSESTTVDFGMQVNNSYNGLLNLSYLITISPIVEFKVGNETVIDYKTMVINAEGIYDTEGGHICMVGCWNREPDTMDCEIFIDIQIPSLESNGSDIVKGTIESKRENSDSLYFDPLVLSSTSIMSSQVDNAFWRMDIEITMVLISNSLTCIFVGLQLLHVKRHPNVLPFISVVMLILITLGHMIPLLLNMEAYFHSSPNKTSVLLEGNGWLEVNEVLVRVITMLAFLLEFRLLQLTWYAKGQEEGTSKPLWVSEKKVTCYSLPIYIGGSLIAWFFKRLRGSQTQSLRHIYLSSDAPSLPFWLDVKSYAGFILDTFLIPQIMFNVFSDSKDATLCLPYYVGTTIVRLFPHAYDLSRSHSSTWGYDPWDIYANRGMNYYSTSWDILISCFGALFIVVLYFQQRFGGRTILPKRLKEKVAYEKVPTGL